jgi:hypothetical protein
MCGIIGIYKHEGNVNVEVYEGLLMLQHRGQDSAGSSREPGCGAQYTASQLCTACIACHAGSVMVLLLVCKSNLVTREWLMGSMP